MLYSAFDSIYSLTSMLTLESTYPVTLLSARSFRLGDDSGLLKMFGGEIQNHCSSSNNGNNHRRRKCYLASTLERHLVHGNRPTTAGLFEADDHRLRHS